MAQAFRGCVRGKERVSKLLEAGATQGPAILVFNAILNFDSLDAGRKLADK